MMKLTTSALITSAALLLLPLSTPSLKAHGAAPHRQTHSGARTDAHQHTHADPWLSVFWEHYHPGDRQWGSSLSTLFESRHIHMGITEADASPVWGTELGIFWNRLSLNASYYVALQNSWDEWNFSASWTLKAGPFFIIPGYNFRYSPYTHDHSHAHEHEADEAHHDHDHDHHHHNHSHEGHTHTKYGHELFVTAGLSAIPYLTPSVGFLWNLYDDGGGFMEMRLDGEIPLVKERLFLEPYASLGLNFGYNTKDYYGWNNISYGTNLRWAVNDIISLSAGIGHNIPLRAAQLAGSDPEAVATASITFSY